MRLVLLTMLAGCSLSEDGPRYDSGLDGLDLASVDPGTLVPGSTLVATGRAFVDAPFGDSRLVLRGSFDDGAGDRDVTVAVPLRFVDFERMEATVDDAFVAALGAAEGDFHGNATLEVDSTVDGERHETRALGVALELRASLTPTLDALTTSDVIFVNDAILVAGDGLLLGGGEGQTVAVVEGCFAPADGGPCLPRPAARVPLATASPYDRGRGRFPFAPANAGIRPGRFDGTVTLENEHAGGLVTSSAASAMRVEQVVSAIQGATPEAVSLGEVLLVRGGGFVGGAPGELTLVRLVGSFRPAGGGAAIPLDTVIVPAFVDGHSLRYVVVEDDDLGRALALRGGGGALDATLTPLVVAGDDEVVGHDAAVALAIAPVVQVVHLAFTAPYVTSLSAFGLRAVDAAVRERVHAVVARDFATVNVDVRGERPTDFAIYAEVEIGGPDPNGLALLGYDNTPGKDVGNLRLHDRIGGVNAVTQQDGFPGYGGVFVESLFLFSAHPGDYVSDTTPDPRFDETFDPFRPDRGGTPVRAADLAGGVDLGDVDGADCPAVDRAGQIRCAVWVLGSLIGTTVSHELGHSLGLANPEGDSPHLVGDRPGRLMESGGARDFLERAELLGVPAGAFCDDELAYLREILPTDGPADPSPRPPCR